jgi:hypothetical protein
MEINPREFAEFLVKAKKATYASVDKMKIEPERPDFSELEYKGTKFYYRDSYCGFFFAPGMEVVRLGGKNGKPIWTMAYSGGMSPEHQKDSKFASEVFAFLKKALSNVQTSKPFRGPDGFKRGEFLYTCKMSGNIADFHGEEKIFFKSEEVFRQFFAGGMVVYE